MDRQKIKPIDFGKTTVDADLSKIKKVSLPEFKKRKKRFRPFKNFLKRLPNPQVPARLKRWVGALLFRIILKRYGWMLIGIIPVTIISLFIMDFELLDIILIITTSVVIPLLGFFFKKYAKFLPILDETIKKVVETKRKDSDGGSSITKAELKSIGETFANEVFKLIK